MLNEVKLKFNKIPWVLRIIMYFVIVILSFIALELLFLLVGFNNFIVVKIMSYGVMILSCILVVKLLENSSPLKRLGFEKGKVIKKYLFGYLIGAVLIVLSALPIILFFSESVKVSSPIPIMSIIFYFLFFIVQGAGEEVLMRGLIFPIIVKKTRPYIAMLITGGFFAVLHLLNPGVNLISVLNLFMAGLLFGYCVLYFDSLWQVCALHSAWNFIQGNILGFNVSGNSTPTLINVVPEGSDLFTGAEFGVEGSIFSVIVLLVAIIIIHCGCLKKGINIFKKL